MFDLSGDTTDDDVIIISNPIVLASPIKGNVHYKKLWPF
jgi:hypothetical protein